MADTPDDALIEAMRASVREQALDPFLSEALTPNALDWIAFLAGHAAYAALVEHLGLTEERDRRRRLLVEHNGHETEYNHMCPACNPLPNEQVWYQRRRLVSKWVEVIQP